MKEQSIAFAEWLHNNGWISIDFNSAIAWYCEENSVLDDDYRTTEELYNEFINSLK